jgi:signal transduction histidine kinase
VFDERLRDIGRADLTWDPVVIAVYTAAIMSAGLIGTALVLQREGHPVGWSFLALATSLAAMAGLDMYAREGAVARPGSLPAASAVAHLTDPLFLAFFASVALALHLTPSGRFLNRTWKWMGWGTLAAALLGYAAGVFNDQPIDAPYEGVVNPLALPELGDLLTAVRETGATLTALGLLVGAASLFVRYRRSVGDDRLQLLWMVLATAPLPLCILVAFLYRDADNQAPQLLATAGWIVIIPVAAALSIARYHLFEVERILSRTFTYLLLTVIVVATYSGAVVVVGYLLTGVAGSGTIAAVLATLTAVSVAAPVRRWLQDTLDRRFNRRRYDALRLVERHLRSPEAGSTIERVLAEALGDPTLAVAYRVEEREQWVTRDGRPAKSSDAVEVHRDDGPVARVSFDASVTTREMVQTLTTLSLAELDNARLRAAMALQVVELHESRARITAAQLAERRRIERNLHDGAQQRLLALGFELQAALLNGDRERLASDVSHAVEQTRVVLDELRDLANGLHPAVLNDGGLAAALGDLSRRVPAVVTSRCTESRFDADVEAAAWFTVCEAVANASKHAASSVIMVEVVEQDRKLLLSINDDGLGGADPAGSGIQGMRDRVEAAGGWIDLDSPPGGGTMVRVELPCGQ